MEIFAEANFSWEDGSSLQEFFNLALEIQGYDLVNGNIILFFDNFEMTISSYADCCSNDYFYVSGSESLADRLHLTIGHKITAIECLQNEDHDLGLSPTLDCREDNTSVRCHPVYIHLDNDKNVNFYLVNESNGYYDSNLKIYIHKITLPPPSKLV